MKIGTLFDCGAIWLLCLVLFATLLAPIDFKIIKHVVGASFFVVTQNNGNEVRVFIWKSDYFVTSTRDEFSHLSSVKLIFMLPCKYYSNICQRCACWRKKCAGKFPQRFGNEFMEWLTDYSLTFAHDRWWVQHTFVVFTIDTSFSWLEIFFSVSIK